MARLTGVHVLFRNFFRKVCSHSISILSEGYIHYPIKIKCEEHFKINVGDTNNLRIIFSHILC